MSEVPTLVETIRATNMRPESIDGVLLATSREALGKTLDSSQKRTVRNAFFDALTIRLNHQTD